MVYSTVCKRLPIILAVVASITSRATAAPFPGNEISSQPFDTDVHVSPSFDWPSQPSLSAPRPPDKAPDRSGNLQESDIQDSDSQGRPLNVPSRIDQLNPAAAADDGKNAGIETEPDDDDTNGEKFQDASSRMDWSTSSSMAAPTSDHTPANPLSAQDISGAQRGSSKQASVSNDDKNNEKDNGIDFFDDFDRLDASDEEDGKVLEGAIWTPGTQHS